MTCKAPLSSRTIESLEQVAADGWDHCANPPSQPRNPFLSHAFLLALEQSGSATADTGWQAMHILAEDEKGELLGCMPLYLKAHSKGEYVFDHGWAEAYEQAGGHYYPKLLCAIPFTPVPGRRLLLRDGERREETARQLLDHAMTLCAQNHLSSLHINFIDEQQLPLFHHPDLLQREGHQFHFENNGFDTFDDFLASLSSRKRTAIRKERRQAVEAGLDIRQFTGNELQREHWDHFFEFYMDTGKRKWGTPYLNRRFFTLMHEHMADQILLVLAFRKGRAIAGALNFIGSHTLYGRYWGACEYHPALHFELCYYQAIEFAIARRLKRVEAGAQGEHKLARGYLPTATHSRHFLPNPAFRHAVGDFLSRERRYIKMETQVLSEHSPFKKHQEKEMEKRTYHIDGMTCGGCTSSLEKKLLEEDGIESASASHEENCCEVTLDPTKVSDERIAQITEKAGFDFKGKAS